MELQPVQVGLPSDYLASVSEESPNICKIGGLKAWLGGQDPPAAMIECKACKKSMVLLCQVNAPAIEGYDRMVYVVVCNRDTCKVDLTLSPLSQLGFGSVKVRIWIGYGRVWIAEG
eukprot:1390761-Amorphochlora_amoeboformis.AAC.1